MSTVTFDFPLSDKHSLFSTKHRHF